MTDNIKPEHYRKGEIDLYEAFSQIFPHNEYRAGMQMIAMRYMFRDKIDRVEDLKKAIYTLERLKEKEIEHDSKYGERTSKGETGILKADTIHVFDERISLLRNLHHDGFEYLARYENGELWAHSNHPTKKSNGW